MSITVPPPYPRPINPWIYLAVPAVVALALELLELTTLYMDIAKQAIDTDSRQFIGRHSYYLYYVLH
ncbi:phosphoesterase, partial [Pseudomonas syringae pv. tagetis]